jgi:non-specific serine/threonine protein kinase
VPHPSPRVLARALALALAASVVAAACGGGGSSSLSQPSTQPSTSSTTGASGPATLRIGVASFRLPAPVSREVLVTDGQKIVALGGLDATKTSTAAVTAIDPSGGTARSFGTLAFPVHDAPGAFVGGRYLVIGGGASSPPQRTTVQAVPGAGGTSQTVGNLPEPRADHVAALVNNTVYVLGGGQEATHLYPSVVASSDGAAWRPAGSVAQPVRYPGVAVVGGAIYLFGGVSTGQGTDTATIQRYDPASQTTQVVGQLPAPLSHTTAVALGGAVYLFGGFINNVVSGLVLRVDVPTGTTGVQGVVSAAAGQLPAPVSDAAAVVVGGTGYLVGGQGTNSAPVDTVLTLSVARR